MRRAWEVRAEGRKEEAVWRESKAGVRFPAGASAREEEGTREGEAPGVASASSALSPFFPPRLCLRWISIRAESSSRE
jgi:hypothetical protein